MSVFLSRKKTLFSILILLALTIFAFCPVLKGQFLNWSDDRYLTSNTNVLTFDWVHMKALLKERINGLHIPLSSLSLSLEHHVFGLNPFVFHLDNLLLHLVNAVLVFGLAKTLRLSMEEAFLAALIFAVHPVKAEAVAWVSSRKELLYSIFYLSSLICYQKERIWLSLICAFFSILANPAAISLPLIMILLDWFNGKPVNMKIFINKSGYLFIALIGWASYFTFLKNPLSFPWQAPLVWIWTFIFYILKFFIPIVSAPLYVLPKPVSILNGSYIGSVFIFLSLLGFLWFLRKHKWVIFSFVFFFLSIFFVIPIEAVKDNNIIADRFLYLPSLSLCLISSIGLIRLNKFLRSQEDILQKLFSFALCILAAGLILLTFNQSLIWRDSLSLWGHQVKVLPHPFALNKFAATILEGHQPSEKEYQQAIDLYRQAIELDPKYIKSYTSLAELYKNKGQPEQSFMWYSKALEIDPRNKEALLGIGFFYLEVNKPQQGIEALKKLLRLYPDSENSYINIIDAYSKAIERYPQEKAYQEQREEVLSEYEDLSKRKKYTAGDYYNLGFLYEQVGGYDEAVRFYKKALLLMPSHLKSLFNLAHRYQDMGDFKSAIIIYQNLIHYYPKYAPAYLNLGIVYNTLGDVSQAKMLYWKAIKMDPKNAGAYFNLGYLYEAEGDYKEALNGYEKAVDINPQLAEAYYNMGNVYAALGQNPEAIASYLKTININNSHQNAYVNLSILLFKSRDFNGAIKYLKEAQRLGYNPPEEYLRSLEPYRKR